MTRVIPINTKVDSLAEQTCVDTIEVQSRVCRICLEGSTKQNILLSLCKCSGSVKYVHEECTKTWILSQTEDIANAQCELCLTKYEMDYTISTRCVFKKGCKETIGHCIFAPLLILVMTLLLFIIYLLIANFPTASTSEIVYGSIIVIVCSFAFLMIIVFAAQSLKNSYCVSSISRWCILPQNLGTEEDTQTIQIPEIPERTNNVLVLPASVHLNGREILTPRVAPSLSSVNRNGQVVAFVTTRSQPESPLFVMNADFSSTFPQA